MIIGNFTYNQTKDTYEGEIKTLTLHRSKVIFRPTEGKTDKGPSYRIVLEGVPGPSNSEPPGSAPARPDGNSCRSVSTTQRCPIRSARR